MAYVVIALVKMPPNDLVRSIWSHDFETLKAAKETKAFLDNENNGPVVIIQDWRTTA